MAAPAARRWRVIVIMVVIALVAAAVGWFSSRLVESPTQRDADAAPPVASVITAAVQRKKIDDSLVTRGTVAPVKTVTIKAQPQSEGQSIITVVGVKAGDTATEGEVLFQVSGRPVFAIQGDVPVYRDLHPGLDGEDVAQLQRALTALGHPVSDDGHYGAGTAAAVAALYTQAGFDPAPTSPDDEANVEAAQDAVTSEQRALDQAKASKSSKQEVAWAQQDLDTAKKKLADVQATTGPAVPAAELVALPTLPAKVRTVAMKVGDDAASASVQLSTGDLAVKATYSADLNGLVSKGQKVQLDAEGLGKTATGTVSAVPKTVNQGDTATFTVTPDDPLDAAWNGQDVRVTIMRAQSKGAVLVVPLSAVYSDADQHTQVLVRAKDGSEQPVDVKTGVTGDGYIQVTPTSGEKLAKGDLVVIGTQAANAGSGAAG